MHNDLFTISSIYQITSCAKFVYAFPLAKQEGIREHDPVAYITGMMTQLKSDELISFQMVLTPTISRDISRLSRMILMQEDILSYLLQWKPPWYLKPLTSSVQLFFTLIQGITREGIWAIHELFHGSSRQLQYAYNYDAYQQQLRITKQRPTRVLSPFEKEVITAIQEKIDQALFHTAIRILVIQESKSKSDTRIRGILSSLAPFSLSQYQSLVTHFSVPYLSHKINLFAFRNRLPSFSEKTHALFSLSEIADLYHFPYTPTAKSEDVVQSKSRQLPAPLSFKKSTAKLDVVVGENIYGGKKTAVGLTSTQRHEHTYIIGKTGMGKSTIIESMALQDILSGKGVAVIDPHGDMVNNLLRHIPPRRHKDVIYINPSDKDYPIGLNLLSPSISFIDKQEEKEWITSSILSIFMKITPPHQWGQRMEHILRNATLTALSINAPTAETPYISLFTIQQLLTNYRYRKQVVSTLQDPILKQYWMKEYALFGRMQQAEAISPITNKLGEFFTSLLSRNILLQEKTTLPLAEAMNTGKILLVNLSKGQLGEERSAFFGTVITSLIQLAAYSRVSIPENKRRDFFVYVDEFQNYATHHFTELFSESRKFHVYFIAAHQHIAQFTESKMAKIISGSSGTIVMLKASPDDEQYMLPFFSPVVAERDIINLPPHHFFMKVTNAESEDAFSGITQPITEKGAKEIAKSIIAFSRKQYSTPKVKAEEQLSKIFQEKGTKEKARREKKTSEQLPITLKKHAL